MKHNYFKQITKVGALLTMAFTVACGDDADNQQVQGPRGNYTVFQPLQNCVYPQDAVFFKRVEGRFNSGAITLDLFYSGAGRVKAVGLLEIDSVERVFDPLYNGGPGQGFSTCVSSTINGTITQNTSIQEIAIYLAGNGGVEFESDDQSYLGTYISGDQLLGQAKLFMPRWGEKTIFLTE